MAEGAISQALYSKPRRWSEPCVRSLLTLRDGGISFLPSALFQAALVERTLRTKIHTETCWRENAFTQAFSFANVHRANFLPKPSRPCQKCPASRPSAPKQQSAMAFRAIHLGHFTISLRPTQRIAAIIPAKRLDLFCKTPRPFQQDAPVFSAKRSDPFSETPRPFQQNVPAFSAKRHDLFTKKRHRTEQGFSLCPARCLDVQTIVRCLLLADLAHRQVGCGSSHKD